MAKRRPFSVMRIWGRFDLREQHKIIAPPLQDAKFLPIYLLTICGGEGQLVSNRDTEHSRANMKQLSHVTPHHGGLISQQKRKQGSASAHNPAMLNQLVAFLVGEQQYALPLNTVQRVVRMVEVSPLPSAPEVVLGVIDFEGSILPVVSIRKRMGAPECGGSLSDQLIVADAGTRKVALVVNSVIGVFEKTADEIAPAEQIVPGARYVEGITRLAGGLLFVHDLHRFFSEKEEQQLESLLAPAAGAA